MKRILLLMLLLTNICLQSTNLYAEAPETIMEKFGKAVVLIASVKTGEQEVGLGSGFIVSSSGIIITNYHVIEKAYPIAIKLTNGDTYDKIFIIDTDKRRDIAILKIKAFGLPSVNLGNSDNIKVGEKIVIIGNPQGLENSISDGLLSAIRDTGIGYKMYQMTAPISPGSSGSPVFNMNGDVIGIATSSLVEGQNLNFCVPINYARGLINETPKMSLEEFIGKEKEIPLLDNLNKKGQFIVYSDSGVPNNHYVPSGWMGDYGDLTLCDKWTSNPHSGLTCIKVVYGNKVSQRARWAGMYWQYPPNNWGELLGYNLAGAKRLTFWARGEKGGERIEEVKIGGLAGSYPDTACVSIGPIVLTKEWQQYVIDLANKDLSNIGGGFCWASTIDVNPKGATFYLDDIQYEF